MSALKKCLFIILGSLCTALGIAGVFLPVLPTTPLLLAAAFFFSRSSERLNAWLVETKAYKAYVEPFKSGRGVTVKKKLTILGISYSIMAVSAILVAKPIVWGILGCVAVFLLWLVTFYLPTERSVFDEE